MPIETTQKKTIKTPFWDNIEDLKKAIHNNRERLWELDPNTSQYKLLDDQTALMCRQLGRLLKTK